MSLTCHKYGSTSTGLSNTGFIVSDVHFTLAVAASGFIAPKLYLNLLEAYRNPECLDLEPLSSMKFTIAIMSTGPSASTV